MQILRSIVVLYVYLKQLTLLRRLAKPWRCCCFFCPSSDRQRRLTNPSTRPKTSSHVDVVPLLHAGGALVQTRKLVRLSLSYILCRRYAAGPWLHRSLDPKRHRLRRGRHQLLRRRRHEERRRRDVDQDQVTDGGEPVDRHRDRADPQGHRCFCRGSLRLAFKTRKGGRLWPVSSEGRPAERAHRSVVEARCSPTCHEGLDKGERANFLLNFSWGVSSLC